MSLFLYGLPIAVALCLAVFAASLKPADWCALIGRIHPDHQP